MSHALALRLTGDWRDGGRRFLSALWHWVEDNPGASYDGPDFRLDPGDLPCADHWCVLQAIVAHHQAGVVLTVQSLRQFAKDMGATLASPDGFDELDHIQWSESTSAGILNYAAILRDYGRRRGLVAGLLEVVRSTQDMFILTGELLDGASNLVDRVRQDEHESPAPPSVRRPRQIGGQLRGRVVA